MTMLQHGEHREGQSLGFRLASTTMKHRHSFLVVLLALAFGIRWAAVDAAQAPVTDIGARLELFVDRHLVESTRGVTLELQRPVVAEKALAFDKPWEGAFAAYCTVIKDGAVYRLYYRGLPMAKADGSESETTCYAESRDGINWTKPALGLFEVMGTRQNNVILAGSAPLSHNFSPLLDSRPGVPAAERFKALAGTKRSGLFAFVSADGIRWRKFSEQPVITQGDRSICTRTRRIRTFARRTFTSASRRALYPDDKC